MCSEMHVPVPITGRSQHYLQFSDKNTGAQRLKELTQGHTVNGMEPGRILSRAVSMWYQTSELRHTINSALNLSILAPPPGGYLCIEHREDPRHLETGAEHSQA